MSFLIFFPININQETHDIDGFGKKETFRAKISLFEYSLHTEFHKKMHFRNSKENNFFKFNTLYFRNGAVKDKISFKFFISKLIQELSPEFFRYMWLWVRIAYLFSVSKIQVQIYLENIKFLIDYHLSEGNGKPLRVSLSR